MTSFMEQHLSLEGDITCSSHLYALYCASVTTDFLSNFPTCRFSPFYQIAAIELLFKDFFFIIRDRINFSKISLHICFTKQFPFSTIY